MLWIYQSLLYLLAGFIIIYTALKIKLPERAFNLKRAYMTPIEAHFIIFATGMLIGILMGGYK